jgi:ribosomal protein S18 acetylase RimI-like enzyme
MFQTRLATIDDANIIVHHRNRMFLDMGHPDDEHHRTMIANFRPWIAAKLRDNLYLGWFALQEDRVIAGAGLLLLDCSPTSSDPGTVRGHLLNFYVEPEFRSQGLGRKLLDLAMQETRDRRIGVVTLNASDAGKPMYESAGFGTSPEMMLHNPLD